ncbi:hypothetical protein M514_01908 [Trichuris suis]|uniref:Uncharacterized protein n=1 Tax=Trichuris suis TaxID=68888 RepID=A0A085NTI9_9BILA|nr:hypothetical protein M513_01908 [Trichuris suis]KFD72785.1 hypothetical protein M514_01908 [Trichuris suis]
MITSVIVVAIARILWSLLQPALPSAIFTSRQCCISEETAPNFANGPSALAAFFKPPNPPLARPPSLPIKPPPPPPPAGGDEPPCGGDPPPPPPPCGC